MTVGIRRENQNYFGIRINFMRLPAALASHPKRGVILDAKIPKETRVIFVAPRRGIPREIPSVDFLRIFDIRENVPVFFTTATHSDAQNFFH